MASLTDGLTSRMIRAAKLDASLYEEVEADRGAMRQAMLVVILSSLAAGVGFLSAIGLPGLFWATVAALGGWFVWAFLVFMIGTRILPTPQTHADIGELLRTTGFSSSPGVIRILGIVPGLWDLVTFVAAVWMLIAMVIAVRQALDYQSTLRSVGVCAIGWLIQTLLLLLLRRLAGAPPMGV